jgi:hypothetical protein
MRLAALVPVALLARTLVDAGAAALAFAGL